MTYIINSLDFFDSEKTEINNILNYYIKEEEYVKGTLYILKLPLSDSDKIRMIKAFLSYSYAC